MYGYQILHEEILDNLIENTRCGKTQQAYIFEGAEGIGNFEAARLFANALVCKNQESAPCKNCPACLMATAETHPDIHIILHDIKKKIISVDQVRDIIADAYVKPFENGKKVYIFKYGDDVTPQAQNALLKILEEPPEYVVFIILAENTNSLLPTILSRSSVIKFGRVPDRIVKAELLNMHPELVDNIDFLVRYAGGNLSLAEKLLSQENFTVIREKAFERLDDLLASNLLTAYDIAEFLEENKEDADIILSFWLDFMRDALLVKNDAAPLIENTDYKDRIIGLATRHDERLILKAAEELLVAQKMRKRYVSLKSLALRLAFSIKK